MKKLPKGHFSKMGHIRWRKERGIKLVTTIIPMDNGQKRATCIFEGNTYVSTGKTHTIALDNLFKILIKKAELDSDLNAEGQA